VVVDEAVEALAGGQRDLAHVVRELDARLPVDLHQLVHAPQRGLRLAGDEVRPHAEGVDGVALLGQGVEHLLVDVVARHDLEAGEGGLPLLRRHLLEAGADALGQVGQVPRVEADAHGAVPQVRERERDSQEVGDPRADGVVRVDEAEEVGRPGLGVGDEGGELPEVGLREAELGAVRQGLVHQVVPVEEGVLVGMRAVWCGGASERGEGVGWLGIQIWGVRLHE